MSIKAMTWVWDNSPYTGGSRLVHLALADVANDAHDNELWMQQSSIAEKSRISVVQVQRILKQMVADGYLQVVEQGGGRGKSTRYRMIMKAHQNDGVTDLNPISNQSETLSSDSSETCSDQDFSSSNSIEELNNPKESSIGFDYFWNTYPMRNGRRIGKHPCQNRWAKMPMDDRRAAYRGAVNYNTAVKNGETLAKDPDRWLRDRLWEDWLHEEVTYEREEWER
jgi:hypothetical protein